MNQYDGAAVSPARKEEGVATGPLLTAADEIAELRAEIARLRSSSPSEAIPATTRTDWPTEIDYADQPLSGARLGGITKQRERIRPSEDFPELPRATTDRRRLEADFVRWGYCIAADALSPTQVQAQIARLLDQAAAERAAKVAHMSHRGAAQLVFNLLPKGQAFRDLIALEPAAAQGAPLVEALLDRILGRGFRLCTAHGSIVHTGGGRQELHQDQGFVPLPHPPYPLYCLVIWTYSQFGLDEGGTYMVPGSHRDAAGNNLVRPDTAFERLADERIVSVTAPPGCAILTDSRVLHSGGMRTAPGTRLASRILYGRGMMRQQENQLACMSDEVLAACSPKLKSLLGFKTYYGLGMVEGNAIDPVKPKIHVGELSMSRPDEFAQDFDWKYSEDARRLSQVEWDGHAEYLGNPE